MKTCLEYVRVQSTCSRFSIPTNPSFSFIVLTVYRPPSSSFPDFISHFSSLLEDLATSNSELIITGDFNIHVDQPHTNPSSQFINLLHDFSLTQHINFPTHSQGHTLDLLITRFTSTILSSVSSTDPALSDHLAILFSITVPPHLKSNRITKVIRNYRSNNLTSFTNDNLSVYKSLGRKMSDYNNKTTKEELDGTGVERGRFIERRV